MCGGGLLDAEADCDAITAALVHFVHTVAASLMW